MRVRSVWKLAVLSVMDIHTTQNNMRSRISNLVLRRSVIIILYCLILKTGISRPLREMANSSCVETLPAN